VYCQSRLRYCYKVTVRRSNELFCSTLLKKSREEQGGDTAICGKENQG
jgi:hypothetical protein